MKDSCFNEFDPSAINVDKAISKILFASKIKNRVESVPLKKAYGRILAKNIKSDINIPNYKNSAMDGYAVNFIKQKNNNYVFDCVGESFAGHPYRKKIQKNEAIKVMTGGMVPNSCNAVIMKELVKVDNDTITVKSIIVENQNIRFPGEDILKNQTVLHKGKEIDEVDIGILASQIGRASCRERV